MLFSCPTKHLVISYFVLVNMGKHRQSPWVFFDRTWFMKERNTAVHPVFFNNLKRSCPKPQCWPRTLVPYCWDSSFGATFSRSLRQHHQEQSKRTTSQKSPFTWEFRMKMPQTKTGAYTLCEPSPSKCTWTSQRSPFTREFGMKMPQTKTEARTLCEPAQANCIRTCHKSHLMREFSAKMPRPRKRALISCRPQNKIQKNRYRYFIHVCYMYCWAWMVFGDGVVNNHRTMISLCFPKTARSNSFPTCL